MVKYFKYPSIKFLHVFFELVFYWGVFLALSTVVIYTGIKFSWHGLYMFSVCTSAVNKVLLFVIGPIILILAVINVIIYQKNTVFSGNLGRVVPERQITSSGMVDVAVIHLDKRTGLKALRNMSEYKGAKYLIREFKQSLELILSDERFAHCDRIEGISPKIKANKFQRIGVPVERYTSIGASITSIFFNIISSPTKLSSYLPVREYRFFITKEEVKNIDFKKLERMGDELGEK